jgi:hypothetical protein
VLLNTSIHIIDILVDNWMTMYNVCAVDVTFSYRHSQSVGVAACYLLFDWHDSSRASKRLYISGRLSLK